MYDIDTKTSHRFEIHHRKVQVNNVVISYARSSAEYLIASSKKKNMQDSF